MKRKKGKSLEKQRNELFTYVLLFFIIIGGYAIFNYMDGKADISAASSFDVDVCEQQYELCERECSNTLDVMGCKEACINEFVKCKEI